MANKIFRADDTNAFGEEWLEVHAEFPNENWIVTRADIKIGNLPVISIDNPEFPLVLNLSSAQTAVLKDNETIYMAVYDENGLKRTCEGQISFATSRRRV